jgi:hypothetical protein
MLQMAKLLRDLTFTSVSSSRKKQEKKQLAPITDVYVSGEKLE